MPCLYPPNKELLNLFGFDEAKMASELLATFFGKRFMTPRTFRNIFSGKNEPKRTFMEQVKRLGVPSEKEKFAENMDQKIGEMFSGEDFYKKDKVPISVVSWDFLAKGLSSNMPYLARVISNIVKCEKQFCESRIWSEAKTEVANDNFVNYILHAGEIELMKKATNDACFGVSLAPLRLKTPLYVLAALEAEYFAVDGIKSPDTSIQIANGKECAVGVFFNNLAKHLERGKKTDFIRKYVVDEKNGDEDSAVRKFRRWRMGESVPKFNTVLNIAKKICNNDDTCKFRIMFLFLVAVYIRNGTEVINQLNIEWAGEYERFLNKHMADIKTKAV